MVYTNKADLDYYCDYFVKFSKSSLDHQNCYQRLIQMDKRFAAVHTDPGLLGGMPRRRQK